MARGSQLPLSVFFLTGRTGVGTLSSLDHA